MYVIKLERHFDAAHHLNDYDGKCARTHGHRWVVIVTIKNKVLDDTGMVIDFGVVKKFLDRILDKYDHYYLNELSDFTSLNPTAENIAKLIYDQLKIIFPTLDTVQINESPEASATYWEEE